MLMTPLHEMEMSVSDPGWCWTMVLILDGNSEHVAHAWMKTGLYWNKILPEAALNLIKCLKQIKWQRLFLTRATFSEVPSNISTMRKTGISVTKYENSSQLEVCTNTLNFLLLAFSFHPFLWMIGYVILITLKFLLTKNSKKLAVIISYFLCLEEINNTNNNKINPDQSGGGGELSHATQYKLKFPLISS